VRFSLEFTRQPDAQLGLVIGALSMGQLLSMIMFVAGAVLLIVIALTQQTGSRATAT
jgi:phosphatidylglycerol:prolipoprotein diacylglycerol transferase